MAPMRATGTSTAAPRVSDMEGWLELGSFVVAVAIVLWPR